MRFNDLTVTIYFDTKSAPIRDADKKVVATIMRKGVYETGPKWRLYDTSGIEVAEGFARVYEALRFLHNLRATS